MFCMSLVGIVVCGVTNVMLDPEPYHKPVSAYVAPTNCNPDGIPNPETGLVCDPQNKE